MRTALGILAALGFLLAMYLVTVRETGVTCHVCITFGGRSECRTASAADQASAVASARTNACAVLSSGVTQGIQCDQTQPTSARCEP